MKNNNNIDEKNKEIVEVVDTSDTVEVFEGETTKVLTKEELDKKKAQVENVNANESALVGKMLNDREFVELGEKAKETRTKVKLNDEKSKVKVTGNPKIRVNKDTLDEVRAKFPHMTDAESIERLWQNYLITCNDSIETLSQAPKFEIKDRDKDIEKLKKMIDVIVESVRRDAEIYALEMQTVIAKSNIEYIEKSKKQISDDYLRTRMALKSSKDIEDAKNKEIEELKQAHSDEIEELKTELETINNTIIEKDKLVSLVEEKNSNLEQEKLALNEEISVLKETNSKEIEELQTQLKVVTDADATSKLKIEELKNTVKELKEENTQLTVNYKDALVSQKELDLLNKEVSSLKEENAQLKAKSTNVEIDALKLEFANNQITALTTDKENLIKDKELLLEEKSSLQDELKAIKEELEKLKKASKTKAKTEK